MALVDTTGHVVKVFILPRRFRLGAVTSNHTELGQSSGHLPSTFFSFGGLFKVFSLNKNDCCQVEKLTLLKQVKTKKKKTITCQYDLAPPY